MSKAFRIPNFVKHTSKAAPKTKRTPRTQQIQSNGSLYPLKAGRLVGVTARYANVKAYAVSSFSQLTPDHPRGPLLEQRWQARTEPLWWSATSSLAFASKCTVRSWACRRIRMALVESLRKRGWDRDGRPLDGGGRNQELYGTLQLGTQLGSIGVKMEQLVKETDVIVSEIMKKQEPPITDAPARVTVRRL